MFSYPVVVCLPSRLDHLHDELDTRLAPFDARITVEPYRRYLQCTPAEFAAVTGLRFDDQDVADVTWSQVAAAYNLTRRALGNQLETDERGGYRVSTVNPKARWRRWEIGGSRSGHFLATPHADPRRLVNPAYNAQTRFGPGLYCDGGPLRLLDFRSMRHAARQHAAAIYQRWEQATAQTPVATSWVEFVDRHISAPHRYPIEQAALEFMIQPRVQAVLTHDEHASRPRRFAGDISELPDVIDELQAGEEAFTDYLTAGVIHGHSLLTVEGQWITQVPGGLSVFPVGTFQQRATYLRTAEAYLDGLTPDHQLVLIEAHLDNRTPWTTIAESDQPRGCQT